MDVRKHIHQDLAVDSKMPEIKIFNGLSRFPELIHGLSTRNGGQSGPPFDSLNLGLSTSDNRDDVRENRRLFFSRLQVDEKRLVMPEQVHSDHVEVVFGPGVVPRTDALVTNQRNLFLSVQTADCFPVLLYDPQFMVVAIAHSGWRGTAGNIVGKTIQKMHHIFGCSPGSISAAIGPGVQASCYQVDEKTAAQFDGRYLRADGPGHYRLDIMQAIIDQMRSAGIHDAQIEADITCTHCATQTYYSYRRDGLRSGRQMAVLGLRA